MDACREFLLGTRDQNDNRSASVLMTVSLFTECTEEGVEAVDDEGEGGLPSFGTSKF